MAERSAEQAIRLILEDRLDALDEKEEELSDLDAQFRNLLGRLPDAIREYDWATFDERLDKMKTTTRRLSGADPSKQTITTYKDHEATKYVQRLREKRAQEQVDSIILWLSVLIDGQVLNSYFQSTEGVVKPEERPTPWINAGSRVLDELKRLALSFDVDLNLYPDWKKKKLGTPPGRPGFKHQRLAADYKACEQDVRQFLSEIEYYLVYLQKPPCQHQVQMTINEQARTLVQLQKELETELKRAESKAEEYLALIAKNRPNFEELLEAFGRALDRHIEDPGRIEPVRQAYRQLRELAPDYSGIGRLSDYVPEESEPENLIVYDPED